MAETGENEVKVLGSKFSPYVLRPRVALNLKGVQYEFLEEKFGQKSELLLKSNPVYKKMPVLIHNGKPVCESMIIVQYIDDVWTQPGTPIMPADAYDRAIHRFWSYFVDDKVFPSIMGVVKAQNEEGKAESTEQAKSNLKLLEEAFVNCSRGKPFFGGDNIGFLDIALGSMMGSLKAAEKMHDIVLLDVENIPQLVGWAERFCSHDAVKEVMPETDKLVEFGQMIRARMQAAAAAAK